jgi:hypothetical protein
LDQSWHVACMQESLAGATWLQGLRVVTQLINACCEGGHRDALRHSVTTPEPSDLAAALAEKVQVVSPQLELAGASVTAGEQEPNGLAITCCEKMLECLLALTGLLHSCCHQLLPPSTHAGDSWVCKHLHLAKPGLLSGIMQGITSHCLAALPAADAPQAAADLLHSTPQLASWLKDSLGPAGSKGRHQAQLHTLSLLEQLINLASWPSSAQASDPSTPSGTKPGSAIAACLDSASVPQHIAEMQAKLCLSAGAAPSEERLCYAVECCYQALVQQGGLPAQHSQKQQEQQDGRPASTSPTAGQLPLEVQQPDQNTAVTPQHATQPAAQRERVSTEGAELQGGGPAEVGTL